MNDTRARLVVLLLGTPQVLEGAERRKNRTTDPYGVFPFRGSDNLDLCTGVSILIPIEKILETNLHTRGSECSQFLLHTISDTREHSGTTGENDVAVEIPTNIKIALVDRIITEEKLLE